MQVFRSREGRNNPTESLSREGYLIHVDGIEIQDIILALGWAVDRYEAQGGGGNRQKGISYLSRAMKDAYHTLNADTRILDELNAIRSKATSLEGGLAKALGLPS